MKYIIFSFLLLGLASCGPRTEPTFPSSPAGQSLDDKYSWKTLDWNGKPFRTRTQDQCTTLQLDEKPFGRVRNQGNADLCFAYSAADLTTYCLAPPLHWKRPTEQVSALDLAFNFADSDRDQPQGSQSLDSFMVKFLDGGGDPRLSLRRAAEKGGVCSEWVLTSDGESLNAIRSELELKFNVVLHSPDDEVTSFRSFVQKINRYHDEYLKTQTLTCLSHPGGGTSANGCFSQLARLSQFMKTRGFSTTTDIFEDRNWVSFLSETRESNNYLRELDDRLCGPHRIDLSKFGCDSLQMFDAPSNSNLAQDGRHVLFGKIDEALAAKKPIGFIVSSNFLQNNTQDTGGDNHAMIIDGRRWDVLRGECQYKVRNSWGAGCAGYSRWIRDCEQGEFWISEALLRKNLVVIYLI